MSGIRFICPFLGLSLVFSISAMAGKDDSLPTWKLPPDEWFIQRVPPPPAVDSEAGKEDLAGVLKMQAEATPEQIARARWTYNLSVLTFGEAFDDRDFNPEKYPQTARFFLGLNDLIKKENDMLKAHFKRPHPFSVDPVHVKRIIVAPAEYSYPGFHTARCVVFVHILSTLDPAGKDAFERVARQVEVDRIMAGEHFPGDIVAGKIVGELIYGELIKDKDFVAEVQHLKETEWLALPPIPRDLKILIP